MMAEDYPFAGRHKVAAVVDALGWRGAVGIKRENFGRDEFAVEAIADCIATQSGNNQPGRVYLFSTMERNAGPGCGAEAGTGNPYQGAEGFRQALHFQGWRLTIPISSPAASSREHTSR